MMKTDKKKKKCYLKNDKVELVLRLKCNFILK